METDRYDHRKEKLQIKVQEGSDEYPEALVRGVFENHASFVFK